MPEPSPPPHPNHGFIARAHTLFWFLGLLYGSLLVLLMIPPIQRQVVYLHNLKFPFFADFEHPENYGLAPYKTMNLRISTPDNVSIGAWLTLSDPFYRSLLPSSSSASSNDPIIPATSYLTQPPTLSQIRQSLHQCPTILFLHGNAATRAFHRRVSHYQAYSSRLGVNVLAIDYRGFGDSSGTPSEEGLRIDARTALDWLCGDSSALTAQMRGESVGGMGVRREDVLVVGNSLGTGVAVSLAHELEMENLERDGEERKALRGVVLLAPFSSIATLLETYMVLGTVPIMAPLQVIPFASDFFKKFLKEPFNSLSKVTNLTTPLLLAHAENDYDIPFSHSETLFSAFIEPFLPPLPLTSSAKARLRGDGGEGPGAEAAVYRARREKRKEVVRTWDVDGLGVVQVLVGGSAEKGEGERKERGEVAFLRTRWGAHDTIGLVEGVQDYMRVMFGL